MNFANYVTRDIVFFDGYCILCNGFVDFLLEADIRRNLKFASLQGKTAKKLLPPSALQEIDSVIFINNRYEVLSKSRAVIEILTTLGGIWRLAIIFSYIPAFLLDKIYDFIARNRFLWFGKKNQCRIPAEDEKERILP